ncbi:MAG: response regulator transcription factor, partial [Vicinamibacteria bacterium]
SYSECRKRDQLSRNPLVCVVDDDPSVRKALSRLFRSAGYDVEIFDSAIAYLEREGSLPPACLVLDIRMPGMSGLELQRRLTGNGSSPPIVFVTAYSEEEGRLEALARGAVDVLYKPTERATLLAAVSRAVGK